MLHSDRYITFNYEQFGEGTPMLILHGNGPDHRMMAGCLEPLFTEEDKIKRIYVDLPGMGRTPAADWMVSSDDMLKAVERMIAALIPGERFILVGQSYGGYLARGLLRKYADIIDGLFLLCPCVIAEMQDRELPALQVMHRDSALLAEMSGADWEDFASITVVQSRSVWERYEREVECGLKLADESFMQRIKASGGYPFSFDVNDVPVFEKPALILTGKQDSLTGYKDMLKLLDLYPHSTFAVLDRAGHNLHLEQEAIFGAAVREWLSRVAEAANLQSGGAAV
ncbi:alpha/beta fold hydrolase ['Paenibacillus yunnanensis' Narsing Rao et al. 2020]|uniref:alpha/beta fold hydrolase n=1 Tax=Paenibacillus tengchongensis TaxID=2608684 RepID=UPI00124D8604|nr:alpha/beta hydrolase [Paenibacillus tengchongensis]